VPTGFWYGHVKETGLVVDWRIIIKWILKEQNERDWIDVAQDRKGGLLL
jgi:hypothetical protein